MLNGEVYGHIFVRGGLDCVVGGEGDDRIEGGYSGGYLHGGEGDNLLYCNSGSDGLFAGELPGDAGERLLQLLPPLGMSGNSVNALSPTP